MPRSRGQMALPALPRGARRFTQEGRTATSDLQIECYTCRVYVSVERGIFCLGDDVGGSRVLRLVLDPPALVFVQTLDWFDKPLVVADWITAHDAKAEPLG